MVAAILAFVVTQSSSTSADQARDFYNRQFEGDQYTPWSEAESHTAYEALQSFVDQYGLQDSKVLEVGCGRGVFQDLVDDYTGVDYAASAGQFMRKTFVEASATALPFEDNSFDAAWTVWVLEHVPDPEKAFTELLRVIKPGGLLFLAPAWQCRTWFAKGYPVRPYSDFPLSGKLIKASIPLRNSILWRALFTFPRRLWRTLSQLLHPRPTRFAYRKLKANFDTFWMSDSDAVNSMDPYEAIVWFRSRGHECLNHSTLTRQLLVRTGPIVLRIVKASSSSDERKQSDSRSA